MYVFEETESETKSSSNTKWHSKIYTGFLCHLQPKTNKSRRQKHSHKREEFQDVPEIPMKNPVAVSKTAAVPQSVTYLRGIETAANQAIN